METWQRTDLVSFLFGIRGTLSLSCAGSKSDILSEELKVISGPWKVRFVVISGTTTITKNHSAVDSGDI